jgi:hypothetical protein
MENNNPFGETIYSYTRAQAISDGVLVDLSQFAVIREHWKINLCCTDTVWAIIQAAVQNDGKDYEGILHDISHMAKLAIGKNEGATLLFQCIVGTGLRSFKLHCGPGDTPVPVLTLMLPNED